MRKIWILGISCLLSTTLWAQVDQIVGEWITQNDKGEKVSEVKIFKATNGMYYGRVLKLLTRPQDTPCSACTGDLKDKPIVGLQILTNLKQDGAELTGGRILDPKNGKTYYCSVALKDGKLEIRGSLDKGGLLGRTQTWIKK